MSFRLGAQCDEARMQNTALADSELEHSSSRESTSHTNLNASHQDQRPRLLTPDWPDPGILGQLTDHLRELLAGLL